MIWNLYCIFHKRIQFQAPSLPAPVTTHPVTKKRDVKGKR